MLKRFWAFLIGLFDKPLTPIQQLEVDEVIRLQRERDAYVKEQVRKKQRTPAEARYEWLCSTGYTPFVHLGKEPKPDPILSCYRVAINFYKNKGHELRKSGKKVVPVSSRKNKWGIDSAAYSLN